MRCKTKLKTIEKGYFHKFMDKVWPIGVLGAICFVCFLHCKTPPVRRWIRSQPIRVESNPIIPEPTKAVQPVFPIVNSNGGYTQEFVIDPSLTPPGQVVKHMQVPTCFGNEPWCAVITSNLGYGGVHQVGHCGAGQLVFFEGHVVTLSQILACIDGGGSTCYASDFDDSGQVSLSDFAEFNRRALVNFDCNSNGIIDPFDINGDPWDGAFAVQISQDCNTNTIPDECDIASGISVDANFNGTPDECESGIDCNGNSIPDDQDIAQGTSPDCDTNGIPDICEIDYSCPEGMIPNSICPDADVNCDGQINGMDIGPVVNAKNWFGSYCGDLRPNNWRADVNRDTYVSGGDLGPIVSQKCWFQIE